MTITISTSTETLLRERAEIEGQDVNVVADTLLSEVLAWEAQEDAETVAVLRRSLESSDAGRVRPLADVAAEMRSKYDLPAHLTDQETGEEVILPN